MKDLYPMTFDRARAIGRSRVRWLEVFQRPENYLLSLEDLTGIVEPEEDVYIGIRDIPVNQIIGSEARSSDFSIGFYPIHKWMKQRWEKIQALLVDQKIPEAIKVYEYGGRYFVRDGNHRVSVAKTNKIEFLTAEITALKIPINVPPNLKRNNTDLFQAKYKCYKNTGLFDIIPETEFQVNLTETWEILEKEILVYSSAHFERMYGRPPKEPKELIELWYEKLYKNLIGLIRERSLTYLLPNKKDTDVFCDIIKLWNSYEKPQQYFFKEILDQYEQRVERQHWFRRLFQVVHTFIHGYQMSADDEKETLLQQIQLEDVAPDFEIPEGDKWWYKYLRYQYLWDEFEAVKQNLGRVPYFHELSYQWYYNLFKPVLHVYNIRETGADFPHFYRDFIRWAKGRGRFSPFGKDAAEVEAKAEEYVKTLDLIW